MGPIYVVIMFKLIVTIPVKITYWINNSARKANEECQTLILVAQQMPLIEVSECRENVDREIV